MLKGYVRVRTPENVRALT